MNTTSRTHLPALAVAVVTLGLLPFVATAESRTFTSADGKTMEAEIVSATNVEVTVKLDSTQRQVRFPIAMLSEEDQAYVLKWGEENETFRLRIDAKKKTTGSENVTKGNTKTNIRSYLYDVAIENWGRNDLDNAMVKYRIYMDCGSFKEGSHGVELIPANVTEEFETTGLSLERSETKNVSNS
ncbi:MAG: hypothetical protein P1U85_06625 [Verrucomicrobiales bacterium]|jgi:hypothetical protein|nr:hypothetical protein [Verrucomicrobiales bacterium]